MKYYKNNVEQVINACLENNLPVFPEAESESETEEEQLSKFTNFYDEEQDENYGLLNERKNIFDNDEFDVFNKNQVDMSKIHMGKK